MTSILKVDNLQNTSGTSALTIASDGVVTSTNGINLGNETLTSYRKGTWNPIYVGGTTNPTCTYDSATNGHYVKIGSFVHIQGRIRTDSATGGAGSLSLGNLPFTSMDGDNWYAPLSIGYASTWNGDHHPTTGYIPPNTTECRLVTGNQADWRDGRTTVLLASDLNNNANGNDIIFAAQYMTNE